MSNSSTTILVFVLAAVWLGGPTCRGQAETTASEEPSPDLDGIRSLTAEARFDEAEALARELLSKTEATHGPTSLEVAEVLDRLVETLWQARKIAPPETRELAERAVLIKEERLGRDHLETADSLLNLGVVLQFTGNAAEAESSYTRAIEIRERELGSTAPKLADALTFLGNMYLDSSRYDEAESLYERILTIQQASYGSDDPRVARTLSNLANLLDRKGEYAKSERLYHRTLEIEEKAFGPVHLDVAWTLNGLAALLWQVGKYPEALSNYERALAIREEKLGRDHLYVAMTLNNIGLLLRDIGDYSKARSVFERAQTIAEGAEGQEGAWLATIRNNLAELFRLMGDYAAARRIQQEVLEIRIRTLGPEDVGVAATLSKIAAIEVAVGECAEAAKTYTRILEIYEKSLGTDHKEYGRALGGLARARLALGKVDEARSAFNRALVIQKKALGPDHPYVAEVLEDLSGLELDTGNLDAARPLVEHALVARETMLGTDHPLVGRALAQLGELHARSGDRSGALELGLRAEALGRQHLRLTMQTLPERQALRYSEVRSSGLSLVLSLAAEGLDASSTRRVWNALVRSRSVVLDEMALRRAVFAGGDEPGIADLAEQLASTSRRLANLTLRGPGGVPVDGYFALLDEAENQREAAEIALAEASAVFRQKQQDERVGLDRVAAALPPDTALVAFAFFRDSYLAFVLDAEGSSPVAVSLGDAHGIDDLVDAWRHEATRGLESGRAAEDAEAAYRRAGLALRRKIWDPVSARLGDAKRVLLVPDATIHLVSFQSLPADGSGYVIETGPVIQLLSAERDVVSYATRRDHGKGLLALGGPSFDAEPLERTGETESTSGTFRGELSGCGDFRTVRFPSLPASAREVKAIAAMWTESGAGRQKGDTKAVRLVGSEASETRFKELAAGKRVLHLATHGFFLGERCSSTLETSRGIGGMSPGPDDDAPPPIAGENPLLLSGLALAGANRRESAKADAEDGILTAEEIAAMDLHGVEWAVLSACDTGVGRVQAGEGVLGLRRAFQIAGTGTVIMSLWAVGDEPTARWMRALYEGRLIEGLGTAEAVRAAGVASLHRRRQNDQTTHPFYWGAFVAAGDWR